MPTKKKTSSTNTCPHCGARLTANAKFCPNCGASVEEEVFVLRPVGQKSRIVAALLAFFLGSFGIHNFYLGYNNRAILQLLITILLGLPTCGLAAGIVQIWAIVEGVLILIQSPGYQKDSAGRVLGD